jgi:hypothetical protein
MAFYLYQEWRIMRLFNVFVVAFLVMSPVVALADLLTFETTPTGATPIDDALLSTPYNVAGGTVRFYFDLNGNNKYDAGVDALPAFEQIGDDGINGFNSTTTNANFDKARSGYAAQLGSFFLRQPGGIAAVPGPFIAAYSTITPIHALSGEIWDIDGTSASDAEQWRVDVLNSAGTVLASQLSPLGITNGTASLDSLPWVFQFTDLPDGVTDLRLTSVGTRVGVGLGFNNFSPDVALPEPGSIAVLALAAMSLSRRKR